MQGDEDDKLEDWVYPSEPGGEAIRPEGNGFRVTDRNLLFLKYYTASGNLVESMRDAGYQGNDESLRTNGYHLLRRLSLPLPALMRAQGLTIPSILGTVRDAQLAHKVTRIKVKKAIEYEEDGKTRTTVQDVIEEFTDVDHTVRLRAAEVTLRLYGLLARQSPFEPVLPGTKHSPQTLAPFIGMHAEEDAIAEEEQEKQQQSEAEARSDVNEIRRKLHMLGYDLVPLQSARAEDHP